MWNLEWTVLAGISVLALAALWWPLARSARQNRECRLLIVGSSPAIVGLIAELEARDDLGWHVLGVVDNLRAGQPPDAGPWLGPVAELPEIIASTSPTHIVLGKGTKRWRSVEPTLVDARLAGIAVEEPAETVERATGKLPIERLTPRSLALGRGFNHSDIVSADSTQRLSRAFSFVVALVGLILTAPLLGLIAIAIKLESTGPVLFSQDRLGMGGRSFRLYKFRTMREAAERKSEWVSDNAHRITRVGRWLRRFRLDELPQLVNVLAGDMNLVGPRPHPSCNAVGSSRVDLQACKLEYSIVSPK